jgi:4'-phosphopantetheinyl transferase
MPLYQHIQTPNYQIWLWQYQTEDQPMLEDFAQHKPHLQSYQGKKRIEKILKEMLIAQYFPNEQLAYHSHGQPYLQGSDLHISISHAYPMVALAVAKQPIGIDIEKKQSRFLALKSRFCTPQELAMAKDDVDELCRIWCAKEALYKADHRQPWSFTQNYQVLSPSQAMVVVDEEAIDYHLQAFDLGEFMLLSAWPQ